MISNHFSIAHVSEQLKRNSTTIISDPRFKPSAVLILLIPDTTGYSILVTARSRHLNNHRGEMAFPGGKFDPNQDHDFEETALRETFEEIGINPAAIRILGNLDDFPTISNFIIHPYVGVLEDPGIKLTLNPAEVEAAIRIPIDFLLNPKNFTEFSFPDKLSKLTVLSLMFTDPDTNKKYNVWGATAHLLSEYLRIIYGIRVRSGEYIRPSLDEIQQYRKQRKQKKRKK